MKKNRMFLVSLAAMLVLVFAASGWTADPPKPKDYPTRPIEAVVQYGAGGGSDIFVRSLFNAARKDIGVNSNVTNKVLTQVMTSVLNKDLSPHLPGPGLTTTILETYEGSYTH